MGKSLMVARVLSNYRLELNMPRIVKFRHWLPILTFCPVNGLPDLIYVTLEFDDIENRDLYKIRKEVRKTVSGKKAYMEDLADLLLQKFPTAIVTVSLAFNRHVVTVYHNEVD